MKKCLFALFLILGTVIGSGFSTGKEVVVFFSRFGYYSLFFIPLAGVLFYFTFYFLMTKGLKKIRGKSNSKFIPILMLICCTVFSASMFAGIGNCTLSSPKIIEIILLVLVFILCFFACFKKMKFLSVTNLILIPLLLLIILIFFICEIPNASFVSLPKTNHVVGIFGGAFFCVLYIILNVSLSSIVIAKSGEGLTKKQIRLVSLVSAIALSVFILLINILVICNYDLISADMPLLALSSGVFSFLLRFVIMVGCLTTLLSTIYIAADSCRSLKIRDRFIFIICSILPFIISAIGFSSIVSWLYPFVSFLGVFILFLLFFTKAT